MPHAVIVYFSFTQQTHAVAVHLQDALVDDGWAVTLRRITWSDSRFAADGTLQPFWRTMLGVFGAQMLGRPFGEAVEIDPVEGPVDLVLVGSPTWWLKPAMPIMQGLRSAAVASLLKDRPVGVFTVCRAFYGGNFRWVRRCIKRLGGRLVGHQPFCFEGNQVQSMLAFVRRLRPGTGASGNGTAYGVQPDSAEVAKDWVHDLRNLLGPTGDAR